MGAVSSVAHHLLEIVTGCWYRWCERGEALPQILSCFDLYNSPESLAKQCHETTESEGPNTTLSSVL